MTVLIASPPSPPRSPTHRPRPRHARTNHELTDGHMDTSHRMTPSGSATGSAPSSRSFGPLGPREPGSADPPVYRKAVRSHGYEPTSPPHRGGAESSPPTRPFIGLLSTATGIRNGYAAPPPLGLPRHHWVSVPLGTARVPLQNGADFTRGFTRTNAARFDLRASLKDAVAFVPIRSRRSRTHSG